MALVNHQEVVRGKAELSVGLTLTTISTGAHVGHFEHIPVGILVQRVRLIAMKHPQR